MVEEEKCIGCQTEVTLETINEYENLKKENNALKEKLSKYKLDMEVFREDNSKTLHFTGLPTWQLLFCLYDFAKDYLDNGLVLNGFQKLLLTLMRMKLNLYGTDLSYRFGGISDSTVSRNYNHVLDVLHTCLKPLIRWPERDELKKTLPLDFRKHCPNCAVIIDCF